MSGMENDGGMMLRSTKSGNCTIPKILSTAIFVIITLAIIMPAYSATVSADDDFSVILTAVNSSIYSDQSAIFSLKIINHNAAAKDYTIKTPDSVTWDLHTDPRSDYIVSVPAGATRTVTVLLDPLLPRFGQNNVLIDVKSLSDNIVQTKTVAIDVFDKNDPRREYLPSITTQLIMDNVIDPRQRTVIKVRLNNLIPRELKGVVVSVESSKSNFIKNSLTIDLKPSEDRVQVFLVDLNPNQQPFKDTVKAKATYFDAVHNRTFSWESEPVEFDVVSYSLVESKEETTNVNFLKTQLTYTFTNTGNVVNNYAFKYQIGFIKDLFTKETASDGTKSAVVAADDGRSRMWELKIGPAKSVTVTITTDYNPAMYTAIILVLLIILYYVFRSPIVVRKSAVSLKKKEQGVSEIKIMIYIKNRSTRSFEDIKIIDRIPHIAEVGEEFHVGTIKPTEIIKRGRNPTIVTWNLNQLESFEERLITYTIKSRLMIIGNLSMPGCAVKYKSKTGNVKSSYSNAVNLE